MRYLASPAQLRASLLRWSLFIVPVLVGLGLLSAKLSGSGPDNPWFQALAKPGLYPPPIAFPIVWTTLYGLMGVALAMVLSARGAPGRALAAALFALQFAMNFAWSPLFFAMHQISLALGLIVAMAVAVAITMVLFWRVRPVAGALLVPYLAWLCFAAVLNWQVLVLNPHADGARGAPSTVRVQL